MKAGAAFLGVVLALMALAAGLPPQKMSPRASAVVVAPPRTNFVMTWTEDDANAVAFEVWHSTDLLSWTLLAVTSNTSIAVPKTNYWTQWKWEGLFQTNADGSLTLTDQVAVLFTNCSDNFLVRAVDAYGDTSDWWYR